MAQTPPTAPPKIPLQEKILFAADPEGAKRKEGEARQYQIFVVNPNGGGLRAITPKEKNNFDPAVSPDGTKIAFISNLPGYLSLYVASTDGKEMKQLTTKEGVQLRTPAFMPDGKTLVFSMQAKSQDGVLQFDLYSIGIDGTGFTHLTSSPNDEVDPTVLPDGRIVYAANRENRTKGYEIFILGPGDTVKQLTTNNGEHPAINPDGSRIVYEGTYKAFRGNFVMGINGKGNHKVNGDFNCFCPGFSVDGKKLICTSGTSADKPFVIGAMGTDTSKPYKIFSDPAYVILRHPIWVKVAMP
ncbi:MAG: TolB family protein [Armatimonadota bacterium]